VYVYIYIKIKRRRLKGIVYDNALFCLLGNMIDEKSFTKD